MSVPGNWYEQARLSGMQMLRGGTQQEREALIEWALYGSEDSLPPIPPKFTDAITQHALRNLPEEKV